jgi:plasmid stabilization system protein ParE
VKFRVLSIAQRELVEAIQWYADRSAAAAVEFVDEYERALGEIKTRPQQFTRAECVESPRDIRQVLLHKFPYVVYYELTAKKSAFWLFRTQLGSLAIGGKNARKGVLMVILPSRIVNC